MASQMPVRIRVFTNENMLYDLSVPKIVAQVFFGDARFFSVQKQQGGY